MSDAAILAGAGIKGCGFLTECGIFTLPAGKTPESLDTLVLVLGKGPSQMQPNKPLNQTDVRILERARRVVIHYIKEYGRVYKGNEQATQAIFQLHTFKALVEALFPIEEPARG